jgi:ATP-binding cassette subfamily F protein 3
MQELVSTEEDLTRSEARSYLARFLFTGDDVDKQVAALSGGERGRLALAKLARKGANLLLLDEPTNHLDIPSQEILQESLEAFKGTILLVSHDRYLIDALATQIWSVSPESRSLHVFRGGYRGFREAQWEEERRSTSGAKPIRQGKTRSVKSTSRELEACEDRIAHIEKELDRLAGEIERAAEDPERVRRLGDRYGAMQAELEAQLGEWERLARSAQTQTDR